MNAWEIRSKTSTRTGAFWNHDGPGGQGVESCPEAALLAGFCEGQLDAADREFVSGHLLHCSRCYFAFTESARLSDEHQLESGSESRHLWKTIAWAAALVLTTSAVTTAFLVRRGPQRNADPGAQQAAQAVPASPSPDTKEQLLERAVEIRWVGGAPPPTWNPPPPPPAPNRQQAQTRFVDQLTTGKGQEASAGEMGDARAQAALTTVLIHRWEDDRQLDDAVAAFQQAKHAIAANPRSLEAHMNLALALEAISGSFRQDARKAWEAYLKLDSTSSRALNIKRHLETYSRDPEGGLSAEILRRPHRDIVGADIKPK